MMPFVRILVLRHSSDGGKHLLHLQNAITNDSFSDMNLKFRQKNFLFVSNVIVYR